MNSTCLIVGAGPTGLTLAIELLRAGVPVRLIEKSPQPAQYSQALVVQARTLEQFERYGIAERAVAQGIPLRSATLWSDGERLGQIDLTQIPGRYPYLLVLPQNLTEALLIEHLHTLGGEVERGVTLQEFSQGPQGEGGTARLQRADGSLEDVPFRWLAGCDGAHSTVRHGLDLSFEGDSVDLGFALGDLHLSGPDVPPDGLNLYWRHGGDVLFLARLPGDAHRLIMAFPMPPGDATPDAPTLDTFNEAFAHFGLRIHAESALWLSPFRVNERQVSRYSEGNVFLAGDAAHIHSPVGGQGMNTGMQDAANLGWKLAAVAHGAPASLLASYNAERLAVGRAVLKGSAAGLRAATTTSTVLEHLRDFAVRHLLPLQVVQTAATRNVSETAVGYRDSEAVHDAAHRGPLRAGDRMPNALRDAVSPNDDPATTLLDPLHESRHLLLTLDVPADDIPRNLAHTAIAEHSLTEEGWTPSLAETLGHGPLLYLIRPDGYIGFRGTGDSNALRAYAESVGLLRGVSASV